MKNLTSMDWLALVLVVVGALNWGLVGAFNFNLVSAIFGEMSMVARVVYVLVGLSAVYVLFTLPKLARK